MRLRIGMLLALCALGALVVSGPVGAKKSSRGGKSKLLKANLKGSAEVPGPGDTDGRGKARIRVNPRKGRVCFRLSWRNIEEPTAAHIHVGRKGVAGPVVVTLFERPNNPVESHISRCVDISSSLSNALREHPRRYYINVHNPQFPDGAIRGQLERD